MNGFNLTAETVSAGGWLQWCINPDVTEQPSVQDSPKMSGSLVARHSAVVGTPLFHTVPHIMYRTLLQAAC